jgi:PAS domain-containing protein
MVQSLAGERSAREHDRTEVEALRGAVAEAEHRRAEAHHRLEQITQATEARLLEREAAHQSRLRELEAALARQTEQFEAAREEANRTRATLQGDYLRISESHARVVASELFGYAVTTLQGELVRCNDAFARLFGFEDAPDALTRTAGRLFPALAGRTAVESALMADGHVDQVESCLERVDGQPVRILESATLLTDTDEPDGETLVEHIVVGAVATPDRDALQAQRLEEVGALTTAMTPEIEALISTAHERGHDLRRLLHEGQVSPGDVDAIVGLTAQAMALVRQLATFSRRQARQVDPVDLGEAITRTEPVLVRLAGNYVSFATVLAPAPPVLVPRDDLDQLLTSLVTFGRDLLPAGGSLTLEVRPPGAQESADDTPTAAIVLAAIAAGYGLQLPATAPALEMVAQRCGARLQITGEPGWLARLEVHFPRCSRPPRISWNWNQEN